MLGTPTASPAINGLVTVQGVPNADGTLPTIDLVSRASITVSIPCATHACMVVHGMRVSCMWPQAPISSGSSMHLRNVTVAGLCALR